jgi:hypothetical protein
MWCIKAGQDAAFVCQMESVLSVYKRPFDPKRPLVCMDETTKQCVREVREPIPASRSHPLRFDGEYERNGVGHLLLFYSPHENWRHVHVADTHEGVRWAECVRHLLEECYPEAERITLVMDNLSTHAGSSLYKAFAPAHARALLERLEFVFTPKHGSWLNMAECEFSVLARQCLDRRIADRATLEREIDAWTSERNTNTEPAHWQFTTEDARVKLAHLYPTVSK